MVCVCVALVGCADAGSETKAETDTGDAEAPAAEGAVEVVPKESGKRLSSAELEKPLSERAPPVAPPEAVNRPGMRPQTAIDPTPGADTKLLVLEARTPAVGRDGRLREAIGIESTPGRFVATLPPGCEAPCWKGARVWTRTADQSTLDVTVFRGRGGFTKSATKVGKYRIEDIPTGGERQELLLVFGIVDGALKAYARVRDDGTQLTLRASG